MVWKRHESHTSVFLVKNVFGLGVATYELISAIVQVITAQRLSTSLQRKHELSTAKQPT